MKRTPHGYHDRDAIQRDLTAGGFTAPAQFECITHTSRAQSARIPAVAYCQGTPLRNELLSRDPNILDHATEVAARAIAGRFGGGEVEGRIQAIVVTVQG